MKVMNAMPVAANAKVQNKAAAKRENHNVAVQGHDVKAAPAKSHNKNLGNKLNKLA